MVLIWSSILQQGLGSDLPLNITMQEDETNTFGFQIARVAVGGYNDAQDVRISMMNRVRDLIRKKNEGIPFDQTESEKEDSDYDKKYKDSNLQNILDEMKENDELDRTEHYYIDKMLEAVMLAEEIEDAFESSLKLVREEPVYYKWLDNVYGVSHTLAAKLMHKFGYCEDFPKVSNLWSYCGLAPGQQRVRGEQLNHDPESKKLAWMVADCIIKQGSNSHYYKEFYKPYKNEQIRRMENSACSFCGEPTTEHDPSQLCEHAPDELNEMDSMSLELFRIEGKDVPDGATPAWNRQHADNRARRYLAKKFLKHYWAISRDLKGLETPDEWVITHGGHEKQTDTFENPFYAKEVVNS